ncbi:hypothetical protein [Methyloglobulus sp.]|uniref:hypothetical protein n=1 Tax=Methyloglobulus sp. TaxID=2518622 RepID=UPI0032B74C24
MNKFRPHHSCICKDIYTQNGNLFLIPELWVNLGDIKVLKEVEEKGFAVATDGQPIQKDSELIIKEDGFFDLLKSNDLLSYTIFSDEGYLKDLPVFFQDEWNSEIKIDSMNLLGWTVNKFTEPALLYGDFPIRPILKGEEIIGYEILDNTIINKWGLINTYEDASKIAYKNSAEDLYHEIWRPLAVCVDKFTLKKLESTRNT